MEVSPKLEAFISEVARAAPAEEPAWPDPRPRVPAEEAAWRSRVAELRKIHNRRSVDIAAAMGTLEPARSPTSKITIPVDGGEITANVHEPARPGLLPAVVHFHGGGFWMGDGEVIERLGDPWCGRLSDELGAVVVNVDYRLAPEHRYPVPVADAHAAVRWVHDHADELGVDPRRIAVHGISAGAFLAAAVSRLAREQIVFQALVAPAVSTDPAADRGPARPSLSTDELRVCLELLDAPAVSPLLADPTGLPDAFVAIHAHDPLRAEGEDYAERLRAAGVGVTVRRFEATHVVMLPEEAERLHAELVAALRAAFR